MSDDSAKMASKPKDSWDKWQIVLGPMGGLLTALAVVVLTFVTTEKVSVWQEHENNARVYTELLGRREEAETSLRMAMFNSIMGAFLASSQNVQADASRSLEPEILKLELLAYNFHESLNLTPLFKHMERKIEGNLQGRASDQVAADCLRRLRKVTNDIVGKQLAALKSADGKNSATFLRGDFQNPHIGEYVTKSLTFGETTHEVTVAITAVDPTTQELQVSLRVRTPNARPGAEPDQLLETHAEFWIGSFEFPMIDNTRLPNDQRCALVLRVFEPDPDTKAVYYEVGGVCFPGSRASLKEKPYYDEVLDHLRTADETNVE